MKVLGYIANRSVSLTVRPFLEGIRGIFPMPVSFGTENPEPVGERVLEPLARRWADRFVRLRFLQQGRLTVYLVYVFVTVLVLLAWSSLRGFIAG